TALTDETQPHAIAVEPVHFLFEGVQEQLHEQAHFLLGTTPVLAAEGEQRQRLYPLELAGLHDPAHGLDTFTMTGVARQVSLARPASVAVHDDGDVTRHVALQQAGIRVTGCMGHKWETADQISSSSA